MSGSKALLDTNIVILLSKERINIDSLLGRYDEFYVSIVTYMETYGYAFERIEEKDIIDAFFELVEVVDVNKSIAHHVITYRKSSKKRIKLPDAIVLATAKYLGADLISDDWDDFSGVDEQVRILKADDFRKD